MGDQQVSGNIAEQTALAVRKAGEREEESGKVGRRKSAVENVRVSPSNWGTRL